MKLLLQILLFLLTWFNLSATPVFSKVALPNYPVSFHKTANQNQESEIKIGVDTPIAIGVARSGISENSFSQKAGLWESSVLVGTLKPRCRRSANGDFENK